MTVSISLKREGIILSESGGVALRIYTPTASISRLRNGGDRLKVARSNCKFHGGGGACEQD